MGKNHNINFEDLFGAVEDAFFTCIVAITVIVPVIFMLVK